MMALLCLLALDFSKPMIVGTLKVQQRVSLCT